MGYPKPVIEKQRQFAVRVGRKWIEAVEAGSGEAWRFQAWFTHQLGALALMGDDEAADWLRRVVEREVEIAGSNRRRRDVADSATLPVPHAGNDPAGIFPDLTKYSGVPVPKGGLWHRLTVVLRRPQAGRPA